ncbi:alpha/beta hydrolase [uncultured Desulfosarcina sp.]|nr:alpha/beta hydrolase [uncultured Desulfosarcina sp.]
MVSPRNSEILVNRIPQSRLKTIDGCGHGFFIEAAETVAKELIQFFKT